MLEGDVARQVSRVLRTSPGDEITLMDNSGKEYRVRLGSFTKGTVEGKVLSIGEGCDEASLKVTLYQGILKGDKFEWVLQKGTELGVTVFIPLICRRSIPQQMEGWHRSRYPRWRKIITEAAEQSGRCILPQLEEPMPLKDACEGVMDSGMSVMPWEQEGATGLRSALRWHIPSPINGEGQGEGEIPPPSSSLPPAEVALRVNVFIGPEGGFEESEVDYARSCGVIPLSLGKRILRSETASIVTVASVLYEAGELGA